MLASRIIEQARILLVDSDAIRWPDVELLHWLNGGQLQIVSVRPDAGAKKANLSLVAGVEQTIPVDGVRLLDVPRNVSGRAVTLISRDALNALELSWYTSTPAAAIKHFTFDDMDPKAFHVYPPAINGTQVRILYSAIPADCGSTSDTIALDDIYEGPLIDWVCYRAWSKDDEAANAGKAAAALSSFTLALTGKASADKSAEPRRK